MFIARWTIDLLPKALILQFYKIKSSILPKIQNSTVMSGICNSPCRGKLVAEAGLNHYLINNETYLLVSDFTGSKFILFCGFFTHSHRQFSLVP